MPKEQKEEIDFEALDETGVDFLNMEDLPQRAKLIGVKGSGKTTFAIAQVLWMKNHGVTPEDFLMCIIDWDIRGHAIILKEYLEDFGLEEYAPNVHCRTISGVEESYAWEEFYTKKLMNHMGEFEVDENGVTKKDSSGKPLFKKIEGRYGILFLDDEGKFYGTTQNEYCLMTKGKSLRERYTEVQLQAVKEQKVLQQAGKLKPGQQVFKAIHPEGQMKSYAVINKNFGEIFELAAFAAVDYGFMLYVATREKWQVVEWGEDAQHEELKALGRPDLIDWMFDYVLRFVNVEDEERGDTYLVQVTRTRSQKIPKWSVYKITRESASKFWDVDGREDADIKLPRFEKNWKKPQVRNKVLENKRTEIKEV